LPTSNYFDLCAYYLLEYEKTFKNNQLNDKTIKQLMDDSERERERINEKDKPPKEKKEPILPKAKVNLN
jgi:hypothetical protein